MNTCGIDLTGKKFGRLFVIEQGGRTNKGEILWKCRCDCGTEKEVRGSKLRDGSVSSCGCLAIELTIQRSYIHGKSGSKIYITYRNMISRCYNSKNSQYKNYGERGITVCDRWRTKPNGFLFFLEDMGEAPSGTSLDRINNNGPYSPDNCKWSTPEEQGRNKSNNRRITYQGITLNIRDWERKLGFPGKVINDRLRRGWSEERALTTPLVDRSLDVI